jgi:Bardet-Biedl syndrome 9 protein
MSVFKAREWWSTQCGDTGLEEIGNGCMAVGNLDNDMSDGGSAKIAVGSFSGILRIYKPSQREFRPDDLKLEQQLGAPILQLEIGLFSSLSPKEVQLAVLHPKRLCIYDVKFVPEDAHSGGGYYQLSLYHKHNLNRSAFNFTYGPFGKAEGKDYIAVQSLDGELTIIEQEHIAFSKFLPNFLVPGPIQYCAYPVDGFVTVNSEMQCQCFKYSALSSSSSGQIAAAEDKDKEGKRAKPEWSTIIGESAYEICIARHGSWLQGNATDIIVLGEHSIFWLDKAGQIRAQKRLVRTYRPLVYLFLLCL